MAWSTMTPFVFGEQPSASRWNNLIDNDNSLRDGTGLADGAVLPIKMAGMKLASNPTGIQVGSGLTTTSSYKFQVGSVVGNGTTAHTFAAAFASAVALVIVGNGDIGANGGVIGVTTTSLTGFSTNCTVGGNYRANYIAIGV